MTTAATKTTTTTTIIKFIKVPKALASEALNKSITFVFMCYYDQKLHANGQKYQLSIATD